jgi:uncharacterized protein (UPF0261 family)
VKRIYVVGTADYEGEELAFLKRASRRPAAAVWSMSERGVRCAVDIARSRCGFHPHGSRAGARAPTTAAPRCRDGRGFRPLSRRRDDIAGVIGIGGGGGTSIITAGMRELPDGNPKLMVSKPLAAGDTSAIVDVSDIAMMPSVTDVARAQPPEPRAVLANGGLRGSPAWRGFRRSLRKASRQSGSPCLGVTHPLRDAGRRSAARRLRAASCSTPPAQGAGRWRS